MALRANVSLISLPHGFRAILTRYVATGQAIDDRRSFVGIPKLFDTLLQGGEEPLIAVKTVVALLAGEPRS